MLEHWLVNDYLKVKHWITYTQWLKILKLLNCDITDLAAKAIFDPCPKQKGDVLGELRNVCDLASGMYIYFGFGLWPAAMKHVVEHVLPRGVVRNLALAQLREEFDNLDDDGLGILQPAEALVLLNRLVHPGLTCDALATFIGESLRIDVPRRELHKYFNMMDLDGNGMITADEFIPMFRYLVLDFFPERIMYALQLGRSQITVFIISIVALLLLVFSLISLVIVTFAGGRDAIKVIHSGVTGIVGVVAHSMSNQQIGFEGSLIAMKNEMEQMVLSALVISMNLSKTVFEKLTKLGTEFEK